MDSSSKQDIHATTSFIDQSASTSEEKAVDRSSNTTTQNRNSATYSVIEVMQEDTNSTSPHDNPNQNSKNMDYNYIRCFISIIVLNALNLYRIVWSYTSVHMDGKKNLIEKIIEYIISIESVFLCISLIGFQIYACFKLSKKHPNQERRFTMESMIKMVVILTMFSMFSIFFICVLLCMPLFYWTSPSMDMFHFDKIIDIIILSIYVPIVFVSFFYECKRKKFYKNKTIWGIIIVSVVLLTFIYIKSFYFIYIGIKRFQAYRNGNSNYSKVV
ncbi:hypothetical protein NEFER03_0301 [Nematocida sp. LUAm3]|nr:hypothetical protein NEFER03_0301 [Nematocida sp. LUAm3]KAI5173753.1 hypothetical protein NEFER02_0269 [Nematocida sp. LUAm2]KAI5176976.1 hypothetical protein NEFER01_0301 [Nematocida sp. LUAm1]